MAAVAERAERQREELRLGPRLLPVVCVGGWLQLAGSLAVLTLGEGVELSPAPLTPALGVIELPQRGVEPGCILNGLPVLAEALSPADAVRAVGTAGAKPRGIERQWPLP